MTVGIYKLNFIGTDKVYIGQSVNIERRFKNHKVAFNNTSAPNKLQEAYNTYGTPTLEIVCECAEKDLDIIELEAINIFNAVNIGFNTCSAPGGKGNLMGELHGMAKYSNNDYSYVLDLLILNLRYEEIHVKTNVSISVIKSIANGSGHKWLHKIYPEKYDILKNFIDCRNTGMSAKEQGIVYPPIKSPEGIIYYVDNIREFSRKFNLHNSNLGAVLRGTRKSHKGWTVCQPEVQ